MHALAVGLAEVGGFDGNLIFDEAVTTNGDMVYIQRKRRLVGRNPR